MRATGADTTIPLLALLQDVISLNVRRIQMNKSVMTEKELKQWITDWRERISAAWRLGLDEESQWMEQQYLSQLGQIKVKHDKEDDR